MTKWTVISLDTNENKLNGHAFTNDDHLDVDIRELERGEQLWPEAPKKIGALGSDGDHITVFLWPETFSQFWMAAQAADGATRHMEFVLEPAGHSDVLSVTNVGLFENMPAPPDDTVSERPEASTAVRVHPVVEEIRTMRSELRGMGRTVWVWFVVIFLIWFVTQLLR